MSEIAQLFSEQGSLVAFLVLTIMALIYYVRRDHMRDEEWKNDLRESAKEMRELTREMNRALEAVSGKGGHFL